MQRTNYDAIIAVSTLYYREFDIVVKVDDLDDLYSMFYALVRNYDLNLRICDERYNAFCIRTAKFELR